MQAGLACAGRALVCFSAGELTAVLRPGIKSNSQEREKKN